MTNVTAERSGQDARRPLRPGLDANRSIRKASVIAGMALLVMSALAGFANFVVIEGLVTPGDAARTARAVMDSEVMFRFGILSWFLVIALDVVVAWALFAVFSPVSTGVSRLAAWFRLVYAAVFMVAISELVGALRMLSNGGYVTVFNADQLRAQALLRIDTFTDIWDAGLLLFGVHLLLIAYLAYRSGYVPKLLGVLLGIAGLGYVVDSFGAVLSRGSWTDVSSFTFIGEFLLALWLVIWGRRLILSESLRHEDPIAVAR